MTVTIRDVAREAQVGVGTVSRVLNDSPAVSNHTRQKVKRTIANLDYAPNPNARRLSLGKTWQVAVVLPNLTFPSYVERLRGVQHALVDSEYDLVLYGISNPAQQDKYFAKLSTKSQVDGLLIISLPPNEQQVDRFLESGVPAVLVDASHEKICHVVVDDIAGGKLATQHLIKLGHCKIAFLSDYLDTPFQHSAEDRYIGYRQSLEDADIPYQENYKLTGERGRRNALLLAKTLLTSDTPPTAIFAASDTQAIGVLDAAKGLNIQVPDELSVIGYDDIRDSEYMNLTTISQPLFDSGVTATNLLLKTIASKQKEAFRHLLPIKLIERKTTASPKH
ncbi:MAG: LacI family DNA-binding transcriptional regulator [Chloroflexota bacterium]|nr:LacI family DNA-binding transcriptional regulator [Chloroflexota bacterium]